MEDWEPSSAANHNGTNDMTKIAFIGFGEAAQAIARAKTFPELLRLQTSFVQQQFSAAGAQSKELFELSTKVAQQTFESLNTAATKTFEQIKRSA